MTRFRELLMKNITVPNLLSFLRILVIAPLMRFIIEESFIAAGITLLISAFSDMLDGIIARRFNCITSLGKILDPIADKLTLIAIVISLCFVDKAVVWFVALLMTKELLMLSGGAILMKLKMTPPASKWYGKAATVIFYTSVCSIVILRAVWGFESYLLTFALFSVTAAAMVFAFVMYARIFFGMLRNKEVKKEI